MVASAGNDASWGKPGAEWENSSNQLGFGKSRFYVFPDMKHGWTIRGDISNKKIARDVNIAFKNAAEFLKSL